MGKVMGLGRWSRRNSHAMTQLTDQQRQEIEREIFAGRKISAIKLHRKATGSELVDAKKAVEDLEVELRRSNPENFVASEKRGCLGVLVCATFVAVAVLVYILRA